MLEGKGRKFKVGPDGRGDGGGCGVGECEGVSGGRRCRPFFVRAPLLAFTADSLMFLLLSPPLRLIPHGQIIPGDSAAVLGTGVGCVVRSAVADDRQNGVLRPSRENSADRKCETKEEKERKREARRDAGGSLAQPPLPPASRLRSSSSRRSRAVSSFFPPFSAIPVRSRRRGAGPSSRGVRTEAAAESSARSFPRALRGGMGDGFILQLRATTSSSRFFS